MNIKLVSLKLNNFMGGSVEIKPDGKNISVLANNRVGKSRLFNAYEWAVSGKNAVNSMDFEIKNLDSENNPIHHLDHFVELIFDIDGKKLVVERDWVEDWGATNGTLEKKLKGHKTQYHIDGSEALGETEFFRRLDNYFPSKWFQTLTNPLYFILYLKADSKDKKQDWKVRRDTLTSLFGDITDDEIIAANESLFGLSKILDGRPVDHVKGIIKEQAAQTKKDRDEKEVRIKENNRTLSLLDLSGLSLPTLQADKETTQKLYNDKTAELKEIESGGKLSEERVQLRQVGLDIQNLVFDWNNKIEERLKPIKQQVADLSDAINQQKEKLEANKSTIRTKENLVNEKNKEKEGLLGCWNGLKFKLEGAQNQFNDLNAKEFIYEPSAVCAVCGAFPENQPNSSEENMREKFNQRKAEGLTDLQTTINDYQKRMNEISVTGTNLKTEIESLKTEIETLKETNEKLQGDITDLEAAKEKLNAEMTNERQKEIDAPEYLAKLKEKTAIAAEIAQLETDARPLMEKAKAEQAKLLETLNAINSDIAKFDTKVSTEKRIKELVAEEKKLSTEYEKYQSQLYMIEQFTRLKVSSLEEKINGQFEIVRWKMFSQQVNGGIEECCDAMVNGVTITGLNSEARINAGADVIRAFSRKLNLFLPVFFDNAESVTDLLPTESQVIRLVKPEITNDEDRKKYSKLVILNEKGEEI